MDDVNELSIMLADTLRTVGAIEPRLGRIQGRDPTNGSQSGSLDRPADVGGDVRPEAVADDVDVFGIHDRFPD